MNVNEVTKTSSQTWHDMHDVDPPDRVEVPDRVTVNEPLSQSDPIEAIEEINLSNEELEKELDRTLEMFKQMEFDEELENTINNLKALSKEQKKLAEETKKKETVNKELQEKQEKL